MPFSFIPITGLNDLTQFPDKDPNIRAHMQGLFDQIKDAINSINGGKKMQIGVGSATVTTTGVAVPIVVTFPEPFTIPPTV